MMTASPYTASLPIIKLFLCINQNKQIKIIAMYSSSFYYIVLLVNDAELLTVNYRKTTQVTWPCDEGERGAHSEKNDRCGITREKT